MSFNLCTGSITALLLLIEVFVYVDQNDYILVFRTFDVLILGISVAEPSGFLWCVRVCAHTHTDAHVYVHIWLIPVRYIITSSVPTSKQ